MERRSTRAAKLRLEVPNVTAPAKNRKRSVNTEARSPKMHKTGPSTSKNIPTTNLQGEHDVVETWVHSFAKLKKTEQSDALDKLIGTCVPAQLRYLYQTIEPMLQKDFISLLPREVSRYIINLLPPKDLLNAAQICRYWKALCEDNTLWREKCEEANIECGTPPCLDRRDQWRMSPENVLNLKDDPTAILTRSLMSGQVVDDRQLEPDTGNACSKRAYWKAVYLRYQRIQQNWIKNRPTTQCHLLGHDEHVITGLQINGDTIVTASDDTTVRIWSASQAKCLHVLTGHAGGVWTLLITEDGTKVISGATDRTIRIWCVKTGKNLHVLHGHTSTVRCMAIKGNVLVTGSRDCTVRVWDLQTGECQKVLIAHFAAVRCVQFDGDRILSGSYDYKIAVFDAKSGERKHLLTGHTHRVYSLLLDGKRSLAVSGSLDTTIRIWDIDLGLSLHTLIGHQSLTSGMQMRGNTLVSANADSTIKVWNIIDGSCVFTLAGAHRHNSAVTSLQFLYDDLVATSSDDGTVKLWDVEKGLFVCDLVQLEAGRTDGCVWRLKATPTMLCCAVGSRNGTEDTKLIMLDFDVPFP